MLIVDRGSLDGVSLTIRSEFSSLCEAGEKAENLRLQAEDLTREQDGPPPNRMKISGHSCREENSAYQYRSKVFEQIQEKNYW
eukprot:246501-Amphidinium_carterae.1